MKTAGVARLGGKKTLARDAPVRAKWADGDRLGGVNRMSASEGIVNDYQGRRPRR